uniref:Thrombospondin-like N-terminal domain-containing protein n=1 Tax=Eptatretus burgeri TaxID=7764 RepID=A0A8C4PZE3_EPTBU
MLCGHVESAFSGCHHHHWCISSFILSSGFIDVLQVLDFPLAPEGVTPIQGLCNRRSGVDHQDVAYRISKEAQLSVPTKFLFPDSAFPADFSLLTTLRPEIGTQAFLLSLYSENGVQQLGLEVGRSPIFIYEDHVTVSQSQHYPMLTGVNLADGKWHRMAISVHDNNITVFVDCIRVLSQTLHRSDNPYIDLNGIVVFGARILDDEVFEVSRHIILYYFLFLYVLLFVQFLNILK